MVRILLVNDDEGVLKSLRQDLARLHGRVEAFTRPWQALDRAGVMPFDLVITGYRMSGMDGLRFIKALKELQPDLPAIMLSGLTDLNASMRLRGETDVFRYLTKPWNADDLCALIHQTLLQRAGGGAGPHRPTKAEPKGALAMLEAKYPGITQPGSGWDSASGGTRRP